jgi:hypothetical protein
MYKYKKYFKENNSFSILLNSNFSNNEIYLLLKEIGHNLSKYKSDRAYLINYLIKILNKGK